MAVLFVIGDFCWIGICIEFVQMKIYHSIATKEHLHSNILPEGRACVYMAYNFA